MTPTPFPVVILEEVIRSPEDEATDLAKLVTRQGSLLGRMHPANGKIAILWTFGTGRGLDGPAGGLYTRLGERFQPAGVTSLALDYRRPGELTASIVDVLVGVDWLESLGKSRIALVGHSFGGAVVIDAGTLRDSLVTVGALSSRSAGTEAVSRLSPKPVLFLHGEADEVLPVDCSRELYERASAPKELVQYPGCGHGSDRCREALDRDSARWIGAVLLDPGQSSAKPRGAPWEPINTHSLDLPGSLSLVRGLAGSLPCSTRTCLASDNDASSRVRGEMPRRRSAMSWAPLASR